MDRNTPICMLKYSEMFCVNVTELTERASSQFGPTTSLDSIVLPRSCQYCTSTPQARPMPVAVPLRSLAPKKSALGISHQSALRAPVQSGPSLGPSGWYPRITPHEVGHDRFPEEGGQLLCTKMIQRAFPTLSQPKRGKPRRLWAPFVLVVIGDERSY